MDRQVKHDTAAEGAGTKLLAIAAAMMAELRPGTPIRPPRLDDDIERDLGFHSLSRVELDVRLPDRIATGARTLRELLDALPEASAGARAGVATRVAAPPIEAIRGTPESAATIVEAFRWHLERHPEREHVTVLDGDAVVDVLTYGRLWSEAGEVARGLAAAGVERGDAVALMLPTGSAFFHAFLGALRAGAIPVPMYPPMRWTEIEEHVRGRASILASSLARVLITVPEAMFVGRIARAGLPALTAVTSVERLRGGGSGEPEGGVAAVAGSAVAMLQYTSGSTGDPKGVVLSHDNLLANIRADVGEQVVVAQDDALRIANIRAVGRGAAATSTDRFVSWLPLYHDMGLIGAWLATMYFGVPLVVMPPNAFLARPSRWLWAIHRFGGTISAGPNFAYEIAASKLRDEDLAGLDLSTWRLAFNGAEPVRAATLERFAARFAPYGFDRRALLPVYGLAEAAVGLTFPPLGRGPLIERIGERKLMREGRAEPASAAEPAIEVVCCGSPLPGHEVRVVDESGDEVPERTEGRIEFRGPSATVGYQRNPQATARLCRDGWLDTGDVGYIAGGELYLTSRAKDLIKRGGHNLHPYDLEAAVGDLPGVRKGCVAVFGTTARGGGTERVIVVAETGLADAAARAALHDRIAALAAVHLDGPADEVLLVPPRTVLKTSSGKIRRAASRELYEKGLLEAPRRAVWLQLARLVARASGARLRRVAGAALRFGYGVYAWTLFAPLAAGTAVALCVLPGPRARYRLARGAAALLLRGLALSPRVEGLEHLGGSARAVIVANHSSYLDAFVLVAALPVEVHFAAKREFARMPAFGWLLRRVGTRFVERADAARGIEDTRELSAAVEGGETIALFPEGGFSRAPGLAPFHLGAFVIAAETGTPVVPVVLRGTRSILRADRWLPIRGPVSVDVQPPVAAEGRDWSAAVLLRERVRAIVLRRCEEPDLAPGP